MYTEPLLSILILDFLKKREAEILIQSLQDNLKFKAKIIYLSNSPNCDYAKKFLNEGKIDTLIVNKTNVGCGVATRQLFRASMSPFSIYCQVDQYLSRPFEEVRFNSLANQLSYPNLFYIDLAANQGNGLFSERSFMIQTHKYLSIPDINMVTGSPGPYSDQKWGEKHVQDYMKEKNLFFYTTKPLYFSNNGKSSIRSYLCGGITLHYTDSKNLFIIKPLKQRYNNFPNLNLTDKEWDLVLSGQWVNGTIPERDKPYSFTYFTQETYTKPEDLIYV